MDHRFTRTAEAAVSRYRIVVPGTAAGTCIQAAANTGKFIGVSDEVATPVGELVDVAAGPTPWLTLGGTVADGDWLTSDAQGRGVTTTTTGHQVIGRALRAGVVGDEIPIALSIGQL